jgi:hypothetical protein
MTTMRNDTFADDLARRVRGEFMEMPGLRLNIPQAQRLWGIDAVRCAAVLDELVQGGVLSRTDRGYALRRNQP